MLIKRYMLKAACGHHHTAVLICFMHITNNFQTCKIYFISIEHKCPVISVFEYFIAFVLLVYVPVNNVGHGGTVSSPKHTFFQGKLEQAVNQLFVLILSLVTDNPY